MTTAAVLAPLTIQKFFDSNGIPLAQGKVYTYEAGTSTPIATYTSYTGLTSNTNPITLNSRGECSIWVTPNVAYKLNVTDSSGNQIPGYPIDQVTVSQLLSLYGGVDTGAANSYVLNFTASFSSLSNGIVIYWIPANTNTGASTLNVNGLGVLPIVNIDGSVLGAGQIQAGTTAEVMYYQGSWQLLSLGAFSGSTIGTFGPSTTLASASTTLLGNATGHVANITGIASITSFGTASLLAPIYLVKFASSLTLIYNATSLILPGLANITTQAGDAMIAQYLGSSNWQVLIYDANTPTVFTVGKPAATTVTSSTTVTADANLVIAIPVASVYSIEGWLNDAGGTSAGGLKGGLYFTGTGSGYWAMNGLGTDTTTVNLTALGTPAELQSAQNGNASMNLSGTLTATTSGNLQLEWAQESSNGTASLVAAGSWLRATRLLVSLSAICTPPAISSIGLATSQTTASVTVSGEGGTGTYSSYSWSISAGDGSVVINSPTAATTTFTLSGMTATNTYTATASCVVTDSSGHTATATCAVTFVCSATIYSGTLTAGAVMSGVTTVGYGFYGPSSEGSISPGSDINSNAINYLYTLSAYNDLALGITIASNPGSGYFTNLSVNGTNYLSASASYGYTAGVAYWIWNAAPSFVNTNTYTIIYT